MKKYVLLLSIGIAVFMATGCKKYEEGPAISFRSAKSRIEGDWILVSGTIDGENAFKTETTTSSLYTPSCGTFDIYEEVKLKKLRWLILENGKIKLESTYSYKIFDTLNGCTPTYDYDEGSGQDEGEWKLEDNNKKLVVKVDGDEAKFNILELRNKSLHLKGTIDGTQYDLKFEQ
jgi:hypothetical protein